MHEAPSERLLMRKNLERIRKPFSFLNYWIFLKIFCLFLYYIKPELLYFSNQDFCLLFQFFFFSNLGLLSIRVQLSHSLPSSCTLIYTPSIVWGINDLVHFSLGSGFLVAQIRTKSIYFKQRRILFKKVIGIYQRLQGKGKQVPQQIVTGSKSH